MSCKLINMTNTINKNYLTKLPIELLTIICTFVNIFDIVKLLLVNNS